VFPGQEQAAVSTRPARVRRRTQGTLDARGEGCDDHTGRHGGPPDRRNGCRGPRARGGALCRRSARRRPRSRGAQDPRRPARGRRSRRGRPARRAERRRAHRRGAAVLQARRPPALRRHRGRGRRARSVRLQPVHRARPRRRPHRRRDRILRQGARRSLRRRHRHRRRPALRVLRAAHCLRPLPAAPPRRPGRDRNPAVLPAARRLRPVPHPGRGDRLLPAAVLARLPAELADAVQLGHPAHPDVLLLPRRLPEGRAGLDLRALPPGRPAFEVRRRHRHRLLPGPLARRADQVDERQVERHRALPAHPRLLGRRRQPGRPAQGCRVRLPRALAPGHRGVPAAARQHRRGRASHAQPEPGQLDPGRVHAPGRGRPALVADGPGPGARAARPVGRGVRRRIPSRGGRGALRAPGARARALRPDDAHARADRQRLDDLQGRLQPAGQPDREAGERRAPVEPVHRDHRGLLRRRDRRVQPRLDQPRP